MGRRYDWQVTPQNTPRFQEKRRLVLLANGMLLLNVLLVAVFYPDYRKDALICAALALLYALIAIFEKRKSEWQWGSVIVGCSLCFLFSALWTYGTRNHWFYIGYSVELLAFIFLAIGLFKKKTAKPRRN